MWARVVEFMLGCWLLCSPFIFPAQHRADGPHWLYDFAAGGLVITLSLLAFLEQFRFAHLGTLALSLMMILGPRILLAPEISPAGQNFMMIGFLLLMFAIVPSQAAQPPRAWQSDSASGDSAPA